MNSVSEANHASEQQPKAIATPDDDALSTSSTSCNHYGSQSSKKAVQKSATLPNATGDRKPTNELANLLRQRQKRNEDPNALNDFESKVQQRKQEHRGDDKGSNQTKFKFTKVSKNNYLATCYFLKQQFCMHTDMN